MIQKWSTALSHEGRVKAWIILQGGAWELLQAEKTMTCPRSFAADDEDFVRAYQWLRHKMECSELEAPGHELTPWWCWVQREGDHPMPYIEDLIGPLSPVVLELSLPAHLVAISCFDAWHYVLNRWYLPGSPEDERAFEEAERRAPESLETLRRKEASWDRVFDLSQFLGTPTPLTERSLQGCFWQLNLEHVVRVVETLDPFPNEE